MIVIVCVCVCVCVFVCVLFTNTNSIHTMIRLYLFVHTVSYFVVSRHGVCLLPLWYLFTYVEVKLSITNTTLINIVFRRLRRLYEEYNK